MEKTINIHIMGSSFLIEEDAYQLLEKYMSNLKKSFENTKGNKEIIEDIEIRIAELAGNYINERKQVLTLNDIQAIINILGNPEDFDMEDDTMQQGTYREESGRKKFYRDPEDKKIGGVCSGIAAYLDIDVLWIRLIFIAFLFIGGFIVPIYILLMVIVPYATTPAQRLEMRGSKVTVENLKNEFHKATERFKDETKHFGAHLKNQQSSFKKDSQHIVQLLKRIFGFALLGLSILLFLAFLGVIFFENTFNISSENSFSFKEFSEVMAVDSSNSFYFGLSFLIAGFSLLMAMFTNAISLLFNYTASWIKRLNLIHIIIIIICTVIMSFQGVRLASDFKTKGSTIENIGSVNESLLELKTIKMDDLNYITTYKEFNKMIGSDATKIYHSEIKIEFGASTDSTYQIYLEKTARGQSLRKARSRSKNIETAIKIEGNQLLIHPIYNSAKADKYREQSVTLKIMIPMNHKVYTDKGVFGPTDKFKGVIDENGEYEIQ